MARRRRRRRAGGRLARPAAPRLAARRPTGSAPTAWSSRPTPPRCSPRSGGCSTSPSPAPASASSSPRSLARGRRRPARRGSLDELGVEPAPRRRAAPSAAVARRPGRRAASRRGRPDASEALRLRRRRAAGRGWPTSGSATRAAGSRRPPRPGGASDGVPTSDDAGAPGRRAARAVRQRARGLLDVPAALVPGARGGGRVGRGRARWASARGPRAGRPLVARRSSREEDLLELLDSVWDQLPFDARGSPTGSGPRPASRRRPVPAPGTTRRPSATVVGDRGRVRRSTVPLDGGEQVRLRGWVDRVELDDDGRVCTSSTSRPARHPPERRVAAHPQLGLYQLAVDRRAVRRAAPGEDARSGGAELVQLRDRTARRAAQGAGAGAADARRRRGASRSRCQLVDGAPRRSAAEDFAADGRHRSAAAASSPPVPGADASRDGAVVTAVPTRADRAAIAAADLAGLLGIAFTDQQLRGHHRAARAGRHRRRRRLRQDHGDGRPRRLAGRHRARCAADQVLGLTFTNKAAAELAGGCASAWPHGPARRPAGPTQRPTPTSPRRRADRRSPTTPTPAGCSASTACGSASSPTPG